MSRATMLLPTVSVVSKRSSRRRLLFICLMLAPLDGVQVDTLLDQLPERTQLSQKRDTLLHRLQDVVDLLFCGESAETKADTRVCHFVAAAQGSQDVARLQ